MGFPECNGARGYSIIILHVYAFHTQRCIKSKFPTHSKSIYMSNIHEFIIPTMLLAGRCFDTAGRSKQLTPTHVLTGGLSQQTLYTHPMLIYCWPASQTLV